MVGKSYGANELLYKVTAQNSYNPKELRSEELNAKSASAPGRVRRCFFRVYKRLIRN